MDTSTKNLQRYLKSKGFYKGALDNIWGRLTDKAVDDFLDSRSNKLTFKWETANHQRRVTAAWQLICLEAGVHEVGAIDGLRGPATEYALDVLEHIEAHGTRPNWRDIVEDEPKLSLETNSYNTWPTQSQVSKYYGKVGENQTMLVVPYPHKLAWDTGTVIKKFSIHEKCHDSALRVLKRALDHYGPERISKLRLDLFGGCLNVRDMRGGSKPSMHSWGIAIDYDPANNQYKWGRDRATFARSEYDKWFDLWEEEGWISLGRERNFDWMHVQAARL